MLSYFSVYMFNEFVDVFFRIFRLSRDFKLIVFLVECIGMDFLVICVKSLLIFVKVSCVNCWWYVVFGKY